MLSVCCRRLGGAAAATLAADCLGYYSFVVLLRRSVRSRDGARDRLGGSARHGQHVEIPMRHHLGGGDAIPGGVAEVRAMLGGDGGGGGRREPQILLSRAF